MVIGHMLFTSQQNPTNVFDYSLKIYISRHCFDLHHAVGSSGGVVVKLLACGARGPGFDSRSCHYDFRDWLSPAFKS